MGSRRISSTLPDVARRVVVNTGPDTGEMTLDYIIG